MPTTDINQRVKRIAGLSDEDVTALREKDITTENDLSYVKVEDLAVGIGLIKRRILEVICKFLATREDQLTAFTSITLDQTMLTYRI
jgi:hypothetical protein